MGELLLIQVPVFPDLLLGVQRSLRILTEELDPLGFVGLYDGRISITLSTLVL